MASAALRDELNCSICLEVYTDPVTLRCGHNFCRACIHDVLESQRSHGGFNCPQCRTRFKRRPCLQKNVTLANIAEHFRSASPCTKDNGTFCTYCIHAPVPALKSCLHCEASLCGDHLRVHSKSPEHILIEPSSSLEDWKCSIHKKVLEYYCTVDCSVICVLCVQEAKHRGHAVQAVSDASRNKMEKVKNVLTQMRGKRRENEVQIQTLQKSRDKLSTTGARVLERVASLFHEIREKLNVLEVQTTENITQQVKSNSKAINEQIDLLEIKNHIMSLNIGPMQDFCRVTDPMAILKDREWNIGEVSASEKKSDGAIPEVEFLDEVLLALQLQRNLTEILSCVPTVLDVPELSNLSFNRTAAANVTLSCDLAIAHGTQASSEEEDMDNRPDSHRVFGTPDFLFGCHYWEVELSDTDGWRVGMAYDNMCGNMESWCLCRGQQGYFFRHDGKQVSLPGSNARFKRLGIYLDYDGGRLSFYNMDPEVRHLHTICTTFTEPLYAAVWVGCGAWVKIIR